MMANRIGRLELLFWCVESILAAGIVFAIVAIVKRCVQPYFYPVLRKE